jgi:hypothetical protein
LGVAGGRGPVEKRVVAPHVVDDGGGVVFVDGLVPAVGLEREDLAVVVDDVDEPTKPPREAEEQVGGDPDVAPPGLGVRRLLGESALLEDVVVDLDRPADDPGAVDAEVVGEEPEEGLKVDVVAAQDGRQRREFAPRQVGLGDVPLALVELPRPRDEGPPQRRVWLELAPNFGRDIGRRRRLVAAGVELVLEVVEDDFDLLKRAEGRPCVAPVSTDLRALPDGDEQLVRDAAAVVVLERLGIEVEPPEHLVGDARHAPERSIEHGLDDGAWPGWECWTSVEYSHSPLLLGL